MNKRNLIAALATIAASSAAFAQEHAAAAATTTTGGGSAGYVGLAVGIAIGLAALGGTLGQGKAVSAAMDGIARNPTAQGKMFVPMIIGLALIESLVVLSFVICQSLLGKF